VRTDCGTVHDPDSGTAAGALAERERVRSAIDHRTGFGSPAERVGAVKVSGVPERFSEPLDEIRVVVRVARDRVVGAATPGAYVMSWAGRMRASAA
jgi:hypothetical protein